MRVHCMSLVAALWIGCGPTLGTPGELSDESAGPSTDGSTSTGEPSTDGGEAPSATAADSTTMVADDTADDLQTGRDSTTDGTTAECSSPALDPGDVVQLADKQLRGNPDAVVTIVEWLGFADPFSNTAYWTIRELMDMPQFAGRLRLSIKHVPFDFHPPGRPAARAAIAAEMQGKLWAYHDLLFQYEGDLDATALEDLAGEAGLDVEQFMLDRDSAEVDARLDADRELGELVFGSLGTPAFVFNGARFTGAQPIEIFVDALAQEMEATEALLADGLTLCEAYEARLKENLSD